MHQARRFTLILLLTTTIALAKGSKNGQWNSEFKSSFNEAEDMSTGNMTGKRVAMATHRAAYVKPVVFRKDYKGIDRSDWMKELPENITKMPLTEIAIPGSHDSFTSSLDPYNSDMGYSSHVSPEYRERFNREWRVHGLWRRRSQSRRKFRSFLHSATGVAIYNWAVTQSLSIPDQLVAGIRYFDFRVATKPRSKMFWTLHLLYGQSTREAFVQIHAFLNKHPKEVVIIDIRKLYEFSQSNHMTFSREIKGIFGNKIVPIGVGTPSKIESLEKYWQRKQQVIVLYHYLYIYDSVLGTKYHIKSHWPNARNEKKAFEKLNLWHQSRANWSNFWVTQGILSPHYNDYFPRNAWDVMVGVFSWNWGSLKSKLALPMCKAMTKWVKGKKIGKEGVNIVITDFVDNYDFIPTVIDLNYK